jgi:hypothetical protein
MTGKNKKLFGIFNIVDLIILGVILLAASGIVLVKSGLFSTSSKVLEARKMVEFDVVMRGQKVTKQDEIFVPGDKSFITIRNVPYTKLEIVKVVKEPWMVAIPDPKSPNNVIAVKDPSAPHSYNYMVTLKDSAFITLDGPVIGGNKIKIGLPIQLEGYYYKLSGIVSDVRVLK